MIASPPDPRLGLFETLLVAAEEPVELEPHLTRLATSASELFGLGLPPGLGAEAVHACAGIALGRLRIEVLPTESGLWGRATVTAIARDEPFPPWKRGADLRSVVAKDWSGSHKWIDRTWLEHREAELGHEAALLVDPGGEVLEAGRANVFAVVDGVLTTPPLDGRILPGTVRATVLSLAAELKLETAERPLAVADLHRSGEVFLTSSVRGVHPARRLDGHPLRDREGETTARIAARLRRRWTGR